MSNHTDKSYLLPANICPCVPATFLKAHQSFRFIDIDAQTHAIDENKCRKLFEDSLIGGLLYVHAYGNRAETNLFVQAKELGWLVIEDCCLCEPLINNNGINNVDLQIYSTGYAKYIELPYGGGFGYVADSCDYYEYAIDYSIQDETLQLQHIKDCLYDGLSYSLPYDYRWLNGEKLTKSLKEYIVDVDNGIAQIRKHKEKINSIYDKIIPQRLQMGNQFKQWRYMLLVEHRDALLKTIFDAGYFVGTNYPSVSHMYTGVECPIAENETLKLLNLFNDFRVSEEAAEAVAKIIKEFYEREE